VQRAGSDKMGGELAPLNKLHTGSSLLTGRAREAALVDENRQLVLENQGLRSVLVAKQVRCVSQPIDLGRAFARHARR
jgi:hypothetical protein